MAELPPDARRAAWAGRAGSRRPTMADVATRAGVSRATVSMVLGDRPGPSAAARERVLRAAGELDYRPDRAARLLARTHSGVLGVLLTVSNPFHAQLIECLYPAAERHGYDLLISAYVASRAERAVVEALLDHRCEALIVLSPLLDRAYLNEIAERVPVVLVGPRPRGAEVDTVHTAFGDGVRQTVGHLVEHGNKRIVHVDGGIGFGSTERRTAYRRAMRHYGLTEHTRVLRGDYTEMSGVTAARTLLDEPELPDAILAANDRCAIGALDVLVRAGVRVPDDIAVTGCDDIPLAALPHIDLTTIRQDITRMSELAVDVAVRRLTDPDVSRQDLVLPPTLVFRGSTSAYRS